MILHVLKMFFVDVCCCCFLTCRCLMFGVVVSVIVNVLGLFFCFCVIDNSFPK